jgi:hypothetical protein
VVQGICFVSPLGQKQVAFKYSSWKSIVLSMIATILYLVYPTREIIASFRAGK